MTYDVAIVGTGANPDEPSGEGYAMAYRHADAYAKLEECDLVACADIVPENARAFADEHGIDDAGVFEDHATMLEAVDPDVVSVTVPPAVHAEITVDALRHDSVRAVHCEKPMADTWGDARLMAREADRQGVNLTFNHQRRFGAPFREAKRLLDDGEIGALERVEFSTGHLYDYGTHSVDLCSYFNDETPAEWVLGGIDYRRERRLFGARNENQGLALWAYENGVHGLAVTGDEGTGAVACHNRLIGTDGVIEVGPGFGGSGDEDLPVLRVRRDGGDWEAIDCGEDGLHGPGYIDRAIEDVVRALDAGGESELCARNALIATEIIFGTYESSRRRGRVDFPLEIEDNPLDAMVESGALDPEPAED